MNGLQLRHYRESNGLSLRQLAKQLGDISASSLGRWELAKSDEVPSWVTDRLFRRMPVVIAMEDLHYLLDEARDTKSTPEQIIGDLLRAHAGTLRSRQFDEALTGSGGSRLTVNDTNGNHADIGTSGMPAATTTKTK